MNTVDKYSIEIVPAVDLRNGRCVRLEQGRFDAETVYDDDPLAAVRRVIGGARWLHVVDLDGARTGNQVNRDAVRSIVAAATASIQCGGGVRGPEDVEALLGLGVRRVVVGSLAIEQPRRVKRWLRRFGPERLVIALDARSDDGGDFMLTSRGWERASATSLPEALEYFQACSARHVLCTDVNRDGTLTGPSTALYEYVRQAFPELELQASGGVRDDNDVDALAKVGVRKVIVGRALLEGRLQLRGEACQQSA